MCEGELQAGPSPEPQLLFALQEGAETGAAASISWLPPLPPNKRLAEDETPASESPKEEKYLELVCV